jgi:hypothetical protein
MQRQEHASEAADMITIATIRELGAGTAEPAIYGASAESAADCPTPSVSRLGRPGVGWARTFSLREAIVKVDELGPAFFEPKGASMRDDELPIEIDPYFGCHLWVGRLTPNGYPVMEGAGTNAARMSAHRVLYEEEHGPIEDGLVLDHACRRRNCVFVEHLEAVTKSENERRKAMKHRLARKQCKRGHVLNEVTRLVTPEMGLLCRECLHLARGGAGGAPGPGRGAPR